MTSETELRDRFQAAARDLPEPDERFDAVVARGTRRRRATQAAFAFAAVAIVGVGAAVTGAVLTEERAAPFVDDVPVPSAPATEQPVPVEQDLFSVAELGWTTTVYGPAGATQYGPYDGARSIVEGPVAGAFGLSDGSLVFQTEVGAPIERVGSDEARAVLLPAMESSLLLRVTEEGGEPVLWYSVRTDGQDQEQVLYRLSEDAAVPEPLGTVGAIESGTDAFDAADGTLTWLACHLQCRVLQSAGEAATEPEPLAEYAEWLDAIDVSLDGRYVATLQHRDPVLYPDDDRLTLVVIEMASGERTEIALGPVQDWDQNVTFTPDGTDILVGNVAGPGWFVRQWSSVDPLVRRFSENGFVTVHPIERVPTEEASSPYGGALWPEVGATAAAGADTGDAEPWRRDPEQLVTRFLEVELEIETAGVRLAREPVDSATATQELVFVDVAGDLEARFTVQRPDGSDLWWISDVRGAAGSIAMDLQRVGDELEISASSDLGTSISVSAWTGPADWTRADGASPVKLQVPPPGTEAGAVLIVVRDDDGRVLDLWLTALAG